MMRIEFTPQRADVKFKVVEEIIYIKANNKVIKVDFSKTPNGKLCDLIDYISDAKRVDGELIVTLIQPLDKDGNELPAIVDFEIDEYEEINYEWKSWEEIEQEKNQPSELDMLALAVMELGQLIMNGGK